MSVRPIPTPHASLRTCSLPQKKSLARLTLPHRRDHPHARAPILCPAATLRHHARPILRAALPGPTPPRHRGHSPPHPNARSLVVGTTCTAPPPPRRHLGEGCRRSRHCLPRSTKDTTVGGPICCKCMFQVF
jgi:hypothetical protein